jgi:methyltransferase (TIGR00027 family)
MALPDLNNSKYVAELRYIQTVHESHELRNPDTFVRHFIPLLVRLRTSWLRDEGLSRLRTDPFYYYLVARTKYYDHVIANAISDGVQRFINVGCGNDTRAYRFRELLNGKAVKVLECDQEAAINKRRRLTRRWREAIHVEHLAIDLNDGIWPQLESWLGTSKPKTLVLIEGVSPYVDHNAFAQFLRLVASRLAADSQVAYDFKIAGVKDDFGRGKRTQKPFRLSRNKADIARFHRALGLRLEHMELSSELGKRLLPDLIETAPSFNEDGLLRLRVIESSKSFLVADN